MSKKHWTYFGIGIFLIFCIPVVLNLPAFRPELDFSQSGQIGDTLGGITAPFINIIGGLLIYLSFQKQVEANQKQTEAIAKQIEANELQREALTIQREALENERENLKEEIKRAKDQEELQLLETMFNEFRNEVHLLEYEQYHYQSNPILKADNAIAAFSDTLLLEKDQIFQITQDSDEIIHKRIRQNIQFIIALSYILTSFASFLFQFENSTLESNSKSVLYTKFHLYYLTKIGVHIYGTFKIATQITYLEEYVVIVKTINDKLDKFEKEYDSIIPKIQIPGSQLI
ncbi:hypothetical protein [Xanthocytophaga agilis]|uniref:Uncharacterized protein n=1 Tax=Xanthocytophaga agilis TaxID=3048010 RepID=A0AAE3R3F8_9BACT|nr:hypothetical protein [Xanthocytophaga agilis]MDJ1500649.1 hypothetical protein [Xanthocytophaga agilis]